MIGSAVEKQGIIRHGAKMLYAVSEATVPKLTVVLRKAYGPENIIFRKPIAAASDPEAMRQQLIAEVRKIIDPYIAAAHALIDDIIDPAQTRQVLIQGLRLAAGKRTERPWRKHGVVPV